MSLISVIVPVYNLQDYLPRCLDSIINQTYKELEIIIVDDGSTDNTPALCDEYAKKDSRIKVIHKQNGGVSSARNAGLDIATGDYIGFIDGDDWAELNLFETLINNIDGFDLSVCSYGIDNGENVHLSTNDMGYVLDKTQMFTYAFENDMFGGFLWNKLFKRHLIIGIYFDCELCFCEDFLFVCQYLEKCKIGFITENQLYHYFVREGSATNGIDFSQKKFTVVKAYEQIMESYKSNCPQCLNGLYSKFLKINVGFWCRCALLGNKHPNVRSIIKSNIKKYYPIVMKKSDLSLKNKFKITLSILWPKKFPNTNLF